MRYIFALLFLLLFSGCTSHGIDVKKNYTIAEITDIHCSSDEGCVLSYDYAIRSSCPYEARCIDSLCTVICYEPFQAPEKEFSCDREDGYLWCEIKGKCLRFWEEPCIYEETDDEALSICDGTVEVDVCGNAIRKTDPLSGTRYLKEGIWLDCPPMPLEDHSPECKEILSKPCYQLCSPEHDDPKQGTAIETAAGYVRNSPEYINRGGGEISVKDISDKTCDGCYHISMSFIAEGEEYDAEIEVKESKVLSIEILPVQLRELPTNDPYACTSDSDCTIKDVHNCCGYYPRCVNKDYIPDIDAVEEKCRRDGLASVCGYSEIDSCACESGTCVSLQDGQEI